MLINMTHFVGTLLYPRRRDSLQNAVRMFGGKIMTTGVTVYDYIVVAVPELHVCDFCERVKRYFEIVGKADQDCIKFLRTAVPVEKRPRLHKGDIAQVRSGRFMGYTGTIERISGGMALVTVGSLSVSADIGDLDGL